jgi:DNA modification methylase
LRKSDQNNSSSGQAIYDPFLGSGTTLIAADTISRVCFAMELEPALVDVAVRRWEAFTGKKAALLSNGRLFEAVAAERLAAPEGAIREPRKPPAEQNHPE